jgi:hypothetical protein
MSNSERGSIFAPLELVTMPRLAQRWNRSTVIKDPGVPTGVVQVSHSATSFYKCADRSSTMGAGRFAGYPAARNGDASHARDTRIKHAAPIK